MGNASSSGGRGHHEESVDYGSLVPQGVYTGPRDWNHAIVSQLIIARKLAPFYRPLEDYNESWDDDQILAARKELPSNSENSEHSSRSEPVHSSKSSNSKRSAVHKDQPRPEAAIYRGAVECPICFLVVTSYISPIPQSHYVIPRSIIPPISIIPDAATKQYAQSVLFKSNVMSRLPLISSLSPPLAPTVSKRTSVLFTALLYGELALAVRDRSVYPHLLPGSLLTRSLHLPWLCLLFVFITTQNSQWPEPPREPIQPAHKRRQKSYSADSPEVVTTGMHSLVIIPKLLVQSPHPDQIRPDWEAKLAAVRAAVARRANRRIIMRQVGDRLIPVGVTSGRVHALNPEEAGAEAAEGGGSRRRRRHGGNSQLEQYMSIPGQDLEEVRSIQYGDMSTLIVGHSLCSWKPCVYHS